MSTSSVKKEIGAGLSLEDWQRAKAVLTVAADMAGEERARWVEAQLPDESALHSKLLSMLSAYDKIKDSLGPERTFLLSASAMAPPPPTSSSTEELIRVGAEYGRYRVVQPLGAGGMGQVFLAEDLRLGRRVALKSVAGRWLGSPTARQRLLREARAAAALSHPNIATLYDVLEDERYFLLVMEYVEGRTAAAILAEGPISLGHAVRLTIQICDAVVYAHDRGIIHCDLKPSNVQVSPDGTAKVLDFGLAHAKYDWYETDADASSSKGLLIGTPPYMPPERLLTGALNVSGDVYSLGVTLFEMATGRRPFNETNFAALTGAILGTAAPRASSIVPSCPASLDDVLARALAKDPKQRYQTARELSTDLQDVLRALDTDSGVMPLPLVAVPRTVWPYSRPLLPAFLALATIVSFTLIGFLTTTFYGSPLGITVAFEGESPGWWPVWGLRSLILPFAQIAFAILVLGIAGLLWRIALDVLTPLRRWRQRILEGKFIGWLRSIPAATLAASLLVAHVVIFNLFVWRFGDLLGSFSNFMLQSGSLIALGPDYVEEHKWYVRVFALLVLVFGWSWCRLLKRKWRSREPISGTTLAAGTVMMILTFFLMVAPYRLLFHSDGERVLYQSQLCYLVGEKGNEGRLFCPLQGPPWKRLVNLNDPALQRSGTTETIFSPVKSEPKSPKIP